MTATRRMRFPGNNQRIAKRLSVAFCGEAEAIAGLVDAEAASALTHDDAVCSRIPTCPVSSPRPGPPCALPVRTISRGL
jgi:hypothetical protein